MPTRQLHWKALLASPRVFLPSAAMCASFPASPSEKSANRTSCEGRKHSCSALVRLLRAAALCACPALIPNGSTLPTTGSAISRHSSLANCLPFLKPFDPAPFHRCGERVYFRYSGIHGSLRAHGRSTAGPAKAVVLHPRGKPLEGTGAADSAAALSGLLIGAEIGVAKATYGTNSSVTLVGSGFLGGLYEAALSIAGFKYTLADGEQLVRDGLLTAARSFWPSRFDVRKIA